MKTILRSRVAWLVSLVAVVLGATLILAAVFDENTDWEAVFDKDLYSYYMAHEVQSLEEIVSDFESEQAMYLPIAVPDPEFIHVQSGGILPFNPKNFPAAFCEGLVPVEEGSVVVYPITVYEDPKTRDRTFLNAKDEIIATVPAPKDYDPQWYVQAQYPALVAMGGGYADWLVAMYDPSRIVITYKLILEDDLINLVWKQSIEAAMRAEEDGGGMRTMGWEGGTVSNLQFVAIEAMTNGAIKLTIAWPQDGLATNMVDFFACTNLMEQDWVIALTTNVDLSTNCFSWVDEDATNFTVRFYDCWTLDDTDGDGISDGREKRLYGTNPNAWDSDGDGVSDYDELFVYGTDPINTHNSPLPYATGFESTNGYSIGALNGQDGWEGSSGATVQSGMTHAGGQAIELEALEATMTKHFAATNNSVTTALFVYLGPQFSVPADLPATASSLVSFEAGTGLRAFDGNGSGGGSWSTASGTANLLNQWVELKIVQNYTAKTWSLYVDGTLKLSGLGFKNDSVTRLGAKRVRSGIGGAVLCDDLNVE